MERFYKAPLAEIVLLEDCDIISTSGVTKPEIDEDPGYNDGEWTGL